MMCLKEGTAEMMGDSKIRRRSYLNPMDDLLLKKFKRGKWLQWTLSLTS